MSSGVRWIAALALVLFCAIALAGDGEDVSDLMTTIALFGIASAVIPFAVGLLKKVKWIGTKFAAVAAFLCGALWGVTLYYVGVLPDGVTLLAAIMFGIATGGTSTGLYAVPKEILKTALTKRGRGR